MPDTESPRMLNTMKLLYNFSHMPKSLHDDFPSDLRYISPHQNPIPHAIITKLQWRLFTTIEHPHLAIPDPILGILCLRANSAWLCRRELTSREVLVLTRDSLRDSEVPDADGRYERRRLSLSAMAFARCCANGERFRSVGPYQ